MKEKAIKSNVLIRFFKCIGKNIKENYKGYLCISPIIIGILVFIAYPMVSSFVFSFSDYDVLTPPTNWGFQNYLAPFTTDSKVFFKSLSVTFSYAIISLPLGLVLGFLLAMQLNQKLKGMKIFRFIMYIPAIIPVVVSGMIWRDITNVKYGLGNAFLTSLGLPPYTFFSDASTTMLTYIIMGLFGLGASAIFWLAALKSIPDTFYEAASLEGAGFFTKLFKITIPMCSPYIFYSLITSMIGVLQTFANLFVITGSEGGVGNSLLFYVMNVYNEAFVNFNIGKASALSWILFAIIGALTLITFKSSKWVYYGEDQ